MCWLLGHTWWRDVLILFLIFKYCCHWVIGVFPGIMGLAIVVLFWSHFGCCSCTCIHAFSSWSSLAVDSFMVRSLLGVSPDQSCPTWVTQSEWESVTNTQLLYTCTFHVRCAHKPAFQRNPRMLGDLVTLCGSLRKPVSCGWILAKSPYLALCSVTLRANYVWEMLHHIIPSCSNFEGRDVDLYQDHCTVSRG